MIQCLRKQTKEPGFVEGVLNQPLSLSLPNKIKSDRLGTVAPKIGKLKAPVVSAAIIEKNKIDAELSPPFILLVTRSLNVASKAVTIGIA